MMKILVTGYTGQLGYDVVQEGVIRGIDMVGIGSKDLNITDGPNVYKFIQEMKPDAIIHCAAYTAVDKAEDDKEKCWKVNVEGTTHLANAAKEVAAKFIYISTDYVFDGLGKVPFIETDVPNPVGFYGLTKYEGEKVVQSLLNEWFIVRISWVLDRLGHDKRYAIDPSKIEKLGWKPAYTFKTGIAQTIDWYLNNKWWWEQIICRNTNFTLKSK
jgi:dTDP-4-dehydrorhamnose reductase